MVYAGQENQEIANQYKIARGYANTGACSGSPPFFNRQIECPPKSDSAYTKYDKYQISLPSR